MREIKFRLLDENNEIVGFERWHVGIFNMEHKKDYYVSNCLWLYSADDKLYTPRFIEHTYKEQYIGLKDKNDNEIYEGDILSAKFSNEIYMIGSIVYDKDDSSFCIYCRKHKWNVSLCFLDDIKIVKTQNYWRKNEIF